MTRSAKKLARTQALLPPCIHSFGPGPLLLNSSPDKAIISQLFRHRRSPAIKLCFSPWTFYVMASAVQRSVISPSAWLPRTRDVQIRHDLQGESKKSNPLKTFGHISDCSRPLQTKIYPVVYHSYSDLCANFGPLICNTFCNLNPGILKFISVYCNIHRLFFSLQYTKSYSKSICQ